jgi:hypothetical protein
VIARAVISYISSAPSQAGACGAWHRSMHESCQPGTAREWPASRSTTIAVSAIGLSPLDMDIQDLCPPAHRREEQDRVG